MKKFLTAVLAVGMMMTFTACNNTKTKPSEGEASKESVSEASQVSQTVSNSEANDTKPVILVVSFGTSYNETRKATIEAIENKLAENNPDYQVRRAFTSQIIIDKLKSRDNLEIDNVKEAMDRLVSDGVKKVVVQPTHVMAGFEYDDMAAEVKPYEEKFEDFKIGSPLLITDEDYEKVVSIITDETKEFANDKTAVVFMGHGTEHPANETYAKLQTALRDKGFANYIIGTVEAEPSIDDVKAEVAKLKCDKVVLLPFMIVAGDHANNDMAGDNEDSWKTVLKIEGYEVECVLKGLGEYEGIRNMFSEKLASTIGE